MSLPEKAAPAVQRAGSGRFSSLDGLRGVAALVVVLWHSILISPRYEQGYPAPGSLFWFSQHTVLKVFTAGTEAVTIFFVLSGMVLVLPVLKRASFDWFDYFPRRVLRLGTPVVASVLLAAVIVLVHPQVLGTRVSDWVGTFSTSPLTFTVFARSFDIFAPVNMLNNPLWTLKWEFIFSMMLPLYVVLAVATARRWIWGALVATALVGIGVGTGTEALQQLPVFYLGALLAVHAETLLAWAQRVRRVRVSALVWAVALAVCLVVFIAPAWAPLVVWEIPVVNWFTRGLPTVAAAGLVMIAFLWRPAVGVLTFAPVRWLGRISFSLYLVHVPILIGVANVFGPGHWKLTVGVGVALSFLVAQLFTRFVEQPAHSLSKRAGATLSAVVRSKLPAPERFAVPAEDGPSGPRP